MSKDNPKNKQEAYCHQLREDIRVMENLSIQGDMSAYDNAAFQLIEKIKQSIVARPESPSPGEGEAVGKPRAVIVDNMIASLDGLDIVGDSFEVDFGGSYKMQIAKREGMWRVVNAMNGGGYNCREEFENTMVELLFPGKVRKEVWEIKTKEQILSECETKYNHKQITRAALEAMQVYHDQFLAPAPPAAGEKMREALQGMMKVAKHHCWNYSTVNEHGEYRAYCNASKALAMSKQTAEEIVREIFKCDDDYRIDNVLAAMHQYASPGWIKASERLPEKNGLLCKEVAVRYYKDYKGKNYNGFNYSGGFYSDVENVFIVKHPEQIKPDRIPVDNIEWLDESMLSESPAKPEGEDASAEIKKQIEDIRNWMYDQLPIGTAGSFEFVKIISEAVKRFDLLIDKKI